MAMRPLLAIAAAAVLSGCGSYPQFDAAVSDEARRSAYPALVPVENLRATAAARAPSDRIATTATGPGAPASPTAEIDARAARLKARASGLRGDVIDDADKDRLNQKIEIEDDEG